MKILLFLLIASMGIAQDILQTEVKSYPVRVVAIDSTYIAFIEEGKVKIGISVHKVFKSITLESGEVLVEKNKLLIGQNHHLWNSQTKTLAQKKTVSNMITSNNTRPIIPDKNKVFIDDKSSHRLSSKKVGGILLALSGGLGLYLRNNEYDGKMPTINQETGVITGEQELEDWIDRQNAFWNIHYLCLGLGGVMISINIDF
ncbi:MAG: hypothetical protein HOB68_03095 [Candidatus Marinimicrobia bacterium]|jgi:hypothetical protein|nr:hypothetical protein [Candidatus Neomarinimicrobiota bacterium]MBT5224616.1 hypothetical protein [Candidatus Neomarinimicrobiota bacterium]MBT6936726.1 hypothetical protein [Candidatus Neomarinimicrobiota bacterium]MBT6938781.1 hypothetical protein [Candidatus Neomarinimicrobiota bacterium]